MKRLFTVSVLMFCAFLSRGQEKVALGSDEIVYITFAKPYSTKFKDETPAFVVKKNVEDRRGNVLIKKGTPVKYKSYEKKPEPGYLLLVIFGSTTAVDGTTIELFGKYRPPNRPDKKKAPGFSSEDEVLGIKVIRKYEITIE